MIGTRNSVHVFVYGLDRALTTAGLTVANKCLLRVRLKQVFALSISLAVLLICSVNQAYGQGFAAPLTYPSGGATTSAVAVGDFNADAKDDVAVTNQNSHTVGVLMGNGDGTFQTAAVFSVGINPRSVAVGDINKDGKADLVVGNETGGNLSLLIGIGDGTFQSAQSYGPIDRPEFIRIADLNGDANPDLAIAGFGGQVFVSLGLGDGTFQAPAVYSTGRASMSVDARDFNNDGQLDLAVANQDSSDVSILFGNGDGTFQSAVNYPVGQYPASIKTGDFNLDGKMDIVTANLGNVTASDGLVSVLLGNGDGTFGVASNYQAGLWSYSVALGDFNADGLLDLAVANINGGNVSVLSGNGDGTFQAASYYAAGTYAQPFSVATGDFNRDGRQDLATANGNDSSMSVLLYAQPEVLSPLRTTRQKTTRQPAQKPVQKRNK